MILLQSQLTFIINYKKCYVSNMHYKTISCSEIYTSLSLSLLYITQVKWVIDWDIGITLTPKNNKGFENLRRLSLVQY